MALKLSCPSCGKTAIAPATLLDRRVRCAACGSIYRARDITADSLPLVASQEGQPVDTGFTRRQKILLTFGLGIPAILLLIATAYCFSLRASDNWLAISERCRSVEAAVACSDADKAGQAHAELNKFIGDQKIENAYLASRVEEARKAYAVFKNRIERLRREREAKELAEQQQAQAVAERQQRELREFAPTANRPTERYYRDRHGAIISESEAESKLLELRSAINAMPDNLERAYMEGELHAVENEWARVKSQGPIEQ